MVFPPPPFFLLTSCLFGVSIDTDPKSIQHIHTIQQIFLHNVSNLLIELIPTSCAQHKWKAKLAIDLNISCLLQQSHFLFETRRIVLKHDLNKLIHVQSFLVEP
jgi:hypothetical protein